MRLSLSSISANNSSVSKELWSCNCKPRILTVDDTPFNVVAMGILLKEYWKIEQESAVNGEIAVNMFKEACQKECGCPNRAYRIIFMDIQMPIMDGKIASSKIIELANEGPPVDTSIIAVTAYSSEDNVKECKEIGMKEVLEKPVNFELLEEIMG